MESWLAPAGFAAGQAQAFPSTRLHPKGLLLEQVVSERQQVTLLLQELLQQGPYLLSSRSPLVLFAPAEPFYCRLKADNIWAYSWREWWRTLTHVCVFLCVHTKSCLKTPTCTFSRSWAESNWIMIGRALVCCQFGNFVCNQALVFHCCKNGCRASLPASFNTQINYA